MQGLPPIALRGMRVEQAVALQEPDRVPFIPTWNNFYQLEYGVSFGESMRDPFTLNAALDHVLDRYEPDLVYMPTVVVGPASPLVAIDMSEVAIFVCPFVPYPHASFLKPLGVGVATEEP